MRKPRIKVADHPAVYHCISRIVGGQFLLDDRACFGTLPRLLQTKDRYQAGAEPRRMNGIWQELLRMAEREVLDTLERLPEPLRARAGELPVTYERHPSPALQSDGIEPDTLGLFVGEEHGETGQTVAPLPAQIILFLDCLWEFADGDPEVYRDEVQATYLHELGHYLGLDELDLDERGLA